MANEVGNVTTVLKAERQASRGVTRTLVVDPGSLLRAAGAAEGACFFGVTNKLVYALSPADYEGRGFQNAETGFSVGKAFVIVTNKDVPQIRVQGQFRLASA